MDKKLKNCRGNLTSICSTKNLKKYAPELTNMVYGPLKTIQRVRSKCSTMEIIFQTNQDRQEITEMTVRQNIKIVWMLPGYRTVLFVEKELKRGNVFDHWKADYDYRTALEFAASLLVAGCEMNKQTYR